MFPIALDLTRTRVLLVGNGELLTRRLAQLNDAKASQVTIFADGKLPTAEDIKTHPVIMVTGVPRPQAEEIVREARAQGKLVNVEDINELCDFYFTANIRRGDLVIAVSTGGASPTLARKIRDSIAARFGEEWVARVQEISLLRKYWKTEGKTMQDVLEGTEHVIRGKGLVAMSQVSLSRLEMFHGALDALPLLGAMIRDEFKEKIGLISSFGADAALLLSLVAEIEPATPVLFLETQKHFPETLDYARTLTDRLGLKNVHWLTPDPKLLANIDAGGELWKTQPNRCCWLRKVEPLDRAVRELGLEALITGRKRYQTAERAEMSTIELDDKGIFRINPLALWDKERQKQETRARNLSEHPLVAKGYLSIGCAPCTAPVLNGQDERAGRWAHTIGIENEQKAECGIHLPTSEITNWSV